MTLSRRQFLETASLVAASTFLPAAALAETAPAPRPRFINPQAWPIMQGPTDSTSTTLIVLHPTTSPVHFQTTTAQGQFVPSGVVNRMDLPGLNLAVSEIAVGNLVPQRDYVFRVLNNDGGIVDQRIFRSLDTRRPFCRFAVVSCMNDAYKDKALTMWETLAAENPDVVFFVGDTCYADDGNYGHEERLYALRYAQTRSTLAWFKLPRLIPSFAVWDDHDFGMNNADGRFPKATFTRELFQNFWGRQTTSGWKRAFGVGSVFEGFGQRFYLMDDRSFRAPPNTGGMHWGFEQREWLLANIASSSQPAWLMNGSQFFGAYLAKESYEGNHYGDFKDLLWRLQNTAAPVAFVSGDVHFSEIMDIEPNLLGYKTHEFTSSAIHSRTFPYQQHRGRNPRRFTSDWRNGFMTFDVDMRTGWNIRNRYVLEGNRLSFERNLQIRR